jgi:membrane protease YdiL (CAAX protease family)
MELETAAPGSTPPSKLNLAFYNDRGLRAGWRLLIFIAILCAIGIGLTFLVKLLGLGTGAGRKIPENLPYLLPLGQGISELVFFLIILFASWVMSRIERRKVGNYGLPLTRSAWPRFFTGYLLWGFLPLTVLLLVMRALHVFYFGTISLHGRAILGWGLLWGFAFLMVGFFEEYSFRGYALYTLTDGLGFWPAAIILALLFAWVHTGNGGETKIGIVGVFLFGIFAAVILWRTGNLWLAVGAHAGWDWGQSFFYGVADSGFQVPGHFLNPHLQGPDWLTGGTVGPEGSILTLILLALMTVVFLTIYKPQPRALVMNFAKESGSIVESSNE